MNVSASLFVLSASLREEMGMDSIPSSLKNVRNTEPGSLTWEAMVMGAWSSRRTL